LYSDSKSIKNTKLHPQCYYRARARWLNQTLNVAFEDILACNDQTEWKKNLNVTSVAIIFAASDLGNASSSYGHTFLKFINPNNSKNRDLIDYGIDYAADADPNEGIFYALKGLVGKYLGRFTMLPYHQKIREYLNAEGRDIWEYHLNFSPAEVDFLIDHILEMENARAPYYFFDENCSYQILKTLEVVKPTVNISDDFGPFVIPIDTIKKITRYTDWVKEVRFKKSLKTDYLQSIQNLNLNQKKSLKTVIQTLELPNDKPFNKDEQAALLEAALKHFAVEGFKKNTDFDQQKYELSAKRASLGQTEVIQTKTTSEPPHLSHDSSAVYLSTKTFEDNQKNRTGFYNIKYRNAFHDLEQPDNGTVPFSHNEIFSVSLNYFQDLKKFEFDRFTILKLYNLNPSNFLDSNMAWKLNAGLLNNWNYDFEGSSGLSYDLQLNKKFRYSFFLTGRLWSVEKYSFSGLGPELLIVYRPTNSLGFSYSSTYYFINKSSDFIRHQAALNWNLYRQFDLQTSFEKSDSFGSIFSLSAVFNFLL